MSADRLGEIAPMTDEHLVEIDAQMKRMGGVLVQGYEWRRLKARLDRAEAALATADAAGFARGVEAMKAGALADESIDEAIIVWFGAIGWLATINEEIRAYYIARMKAFVGAAVSTAARALLPRVTP